ncbi:MAG: GGDEF domain-containing protein, partial [Oscillospiraceae bacterium]|nr:GGDEF domain-containing protein [Oscillospiraceae bacterium]
MIHGKHIVSLCISRLHDLENARFIMQLNKLLSSHGCSLWIYGINVDLYWNEEEYNAESSVFDLIDYEHSDVIVVMDEKIKSRRVADSIIEKALSSGIPLILADGVHEGCSEVRYNYADSFEKIVRHLFDVHHIQRPHFMAGIPDNPFSDERMEVFHRVVEEYGIPYSKETMVSYGYFWAKPAKAATAEILSRPVIPDAIICANDIMAINVCSVIQEHGLRVPEDIIVTGFDGIDEINFSNPTITSALCGTSGMSKSIFEAVMEAIDGKPAHEFLVSPDLLINCSCGCNRDAQVLDHRHSFNDRFYRYQDDNRALSDMCERMQSFSSIEESGYTLFGDVLTDVCCLINMSCTDCTKDYFREKRTAAFDDDMLLFFDTDQNPFRQTPMQRSDVIPHLKEVMDKGFPLIFTALDFMNVPMGYLCFHFQEYEITDYSKIPDIVTTLSIGIGGFINRQYQSHLVRQIEAMYRYDPLTGLCNRLSFNKDFEALCQEHGNENLPLTMLLSDLDGLKPINDNYGHAAGDSAIATVAAALKFSCPPQALCVRFGGDEMIAVFTGKYDGRVISEKIEQYLADYNARSGLPYDISASIGICRTTLRTNTDFEAVMHKADQSMYEIKQKRKTRAANAN